MFRLKIITLAILLTQLMFGQKTKSTTIKYQNSKQIRVEYERLRKNKKIKHGIYREYHFNGNLKIEGKYSHNKKDGVWILTNANGIEQEKQEYEKGNKIGIWTKFIESNQVQLRFDHNMKEELEPIISVVLGYPRNARKLGIEGLVVYEYQIDSITCQIEYVTLVKSVSKECDKTVLESLEKYYKFKTKYSVKKCEFEKGRKKWKMAFKLE